jgi:hypothetical protein
VRRRFNNDLFVARARPQRSYLGHPVLRKQSHAGGQWNRQRGPRTFMCKDTHSWSINLPRVGRQRDHVSFALL